MRKLSKGTMMAVAFALSMAVATPFAVAQSAGTDEGAKGEHSKRWNKSGKHRKHGERGMRGGGRLFKGLELSDAQKAQLEQIRASNRETLRPLMEQMRSKRQEIRQLKAAGNADEAVLKQKLTEIAEVRAQLMAERSRLHEEMLTVLTPEQRTELEQKREQFKNRRMERRERKTAQDAV